MRSSISRSSSRSRRTPQLPGGILRGGGRGVRGGVAAPRTHTILRGQVVVAQGEGKGLGSVPVVGREQIGVDWIC